MSEKKSPGPVEASIARLRELRYMTRGPGSMPAKIDRGPIIEKLRTDVAKIEASKPAKVKKRKPKKKRKARR